MKKTIQRTLLTVIFLLLYLPQSFSTEKYFVDNQFVLLYKLINWWYSCEEEDCNFLCGRKLKTIIYGGKNISLYKNTLTLKFSDLLIHLPEKKVFSMDMGSVLLITEKTMTIKFSKLNARKRKYIKDNLKSLSIIVTGSIKGIYNSDIIILNGKFEKKCPVIKDDAEISLVNINNMKVVEKYILNKKP